MGKKSKVTSIDVARYAGVSQSAVSRAFSKTPTQSGVSPDTKKKIMEAANTLGYRPNAVARSLITQRSNIIALLFSYLDNQFYANSLEKLCIELQKKGFHALVFMMPTTDEGVGRTVEELLQYQVDGIITASVEMSSTLCKLCEEHGIPVVMFNRIRADDGVSSVTTDNVAGGRIAAKYLLETGHERISLLSGWQRASTSRDRCFGFEAELRNNNTSLCSHEIGYFNLELVREPLDHIVQVDKPDAIFVVNDYMAIEAVSRIRHTHQLRVPEDISVIGFDDIAMAAIPEFSLTTIRQPINQMVSNATRLMVDAVENGSTDVENIALAPRLIKRKTVAYR